MAAGQRPGSLPRELLKLLECPLNLTANFPQTKSKKNQRRHNDFIFQSHTPSCKSAIHFIQKPYPLTSTSLCHQKLQRAVFSSPRLLLQPATVLQGNKELDLTEVPKRTHMQRREHKRKCGHILKHHNTLLHKHTFLYGILYCFIQFMASSQHLILLHFMFAWQLLTFPTTM